MRRLFLIFFLVCQLIFPAQAQWDLVTKQLTTENGLPSNTIYDIFQASDGAILVSTNNGLCRYNGLSFSVYESAAGPIGLTQIIEYKTGSFLVRSFNDQSYLTTEKNELFEIPKLRAKETYSIFSDENGAIYKFSGSEIELIYKDGVFKSESILKRKSSEGMYNYCRVFKDTLYALSSETLTIIPLKNQSNQRKVEIRDLSNPVFIKRVNGLDIFSVSKGIVGRLQSNKLVKKVQLPNFDPSDKYAHHIVLSDGRLLIATWGGLYVYTQNYEFIGKYLVDYQISALREDTNRNILIGTQQDGIFIVPSLEVRSLVKSFFYDRKLKIAASKAVGDSLMALGSFDGRIVFINEKGEFVRETNLGVKSEVQAMEYFAEEHKLIVHCYRLFEIDVRTGKVIKTSETNSIKDVIRIGRDTLVTGSSSGLSLYVKGKNITSSHAKFWVTEMCHFGNGILLNTKHGLRFYDPRTNLVENPHLYEGKKIRRMISDKKGGAFMLVENDLVHLSEGGVNSKCATLQSDGAKSMVLRNGIVWMLTNESVYSYDVATKQLSWRVSKKEVDLSFAKELHFLGNNMLIVGINEVKFFNSIPERKLGKPTLRIKSINGTFGLSEGEYSSSYAANKLEVALELLPNVAGRTGSNIRYQILNLDGGKGWKSVSASNLISLERLPYGFYVLQISGFDELGRRSNMINIRLNIHKPFYATSWFLILCFILLGVLLYFVQKRREALITKKNLQKLSVERLKNRALNSELKAIRSQMNPHFIFNSINSIQTQILSHDSYRAYESLSDFATLLRQSLDFTSKEYISLEDELNFLKNYVKLELIRTNDGFDFSMNVPADFGMKSAQVPSLITQPFVENAIRHGLIHLTGEKKLSVEVIGTREDYTIRIEDNGVGRRRSEEINKLNRKDHTSFASKAISERIEMINTSGQMKITFEIIDLPKGTVVELKFKQT